MNSAHKDTKFSAIVQNGYSFIIYKKNYKSLTIVSCGIFETRISANFLLKILLHMLSNQFRHTASQDLENSYTE